MKSILTIVASLFLAISCVEPAPARLPEPIAEVNDPVQWREFCQREGQADPACKQN